MHDYRPAHHHFRLQRLDFPSARHGVRHRLTASRLHSVPNFHFRNRQSTGTRLRITSRSLEVQRKLTSLVLASLQDRGYQQSAQNADLVIKISTGSGNLPGDKVQRGNRAADATGSFIGIDAYDSASGAGVWHGSAFAEIDPARIDDRLLSRGVQDMLAAFPARGQ